MRADRETHGFVERDTLRAALALELPENTTFIVQPSLFTTFGWRKSVVSSGVGGATAGNEWNLLPVVFLERPFRFSRDRLRASVTRMPKWRASSPATAAAGRARKSCSRSRPQTPRWNHCGAKSRD